MSRTKLLVVEDEGIVAMDIADRLTAMGYEVIGSAGSGKEAIALVEKKRPDLILMDIVIEGDFDGVATASYIHKHYQVPVVFLTANSDPRTLNRAKATSPFGYLLKPFEERELQVAVEMALYRHRAEEKIKLHQVWLTTVLSCIGDGIIATDPSGTIQLVNTAAERMLDCKSTDLLGKPILDTVKIVDPSGYNVTADLLESSRNDAAATDISNCKLSNFSGRQVVRVIGSAAAIVAADKINRGMIIAFRESDQARQEAGRTSAAGRSKTTCP